MELPVVLYYLVRSSIIDISLSTDTRLILITALMLAVGILTPDGSMFTQILISVPLYLMIEGAVFLGKR